MHRACRAACSTADGIQEIRYPGSSAGKTHGGQEPILRIIDEQKRSRLSGRGLQLQCFGELRQFGFLIGRQHVEGLRFVGTVAAGGLLLQRLDIQHELAHLDGAGVSGFEQLVKGVYFCEIWL